MKEFAIAELFSIDKKKSWAHKMAIDRALESNLYYVLGNSRVVIALLYNYSILYGSLIFFVVFKLFEWKIASFWWKKYDLFREYKLDM